MGLIPRITTLNMQLTLYEKLLIQLTIITHKTMSIISPLLPPEKKLKSNQTITKEKIQKTYSSSACKKNQSKNYYEKLLTKTTTIVSSSKNHPCLGFLSSIKNMK